MSSSMLDLNLLHPLHSDIAFEHRIFPDGQVNISLDIEKTDVAEKEIRIITRISSANDLLVALYAADVLSYNGCRATDLYISYLTTARMDRVMTNGEPFSLRIISNILNTAGFRRVIIFDPHSNVSTALIDRSYAINNKTFVAAAVEKILAANPAIKRDGLMLISPDAGALKKIYDVSEYLGNMPVVECNKSRDIVTGKLKGFTVFADDLSGKTCLMVDDILDGGGTFSGIAKELKRLNAAKVFAVVSHGIFSKGFYIENVEEIHTTNSYRNWSGLPGHIQVIDCEKFLVTNAKEQLPFL